MVNPLGVCNLEGGCVCDVKIFDKATFNESPLPPNVLQIYPTVCLNDMVACQHAIPMSKTELKNSATQTQPRHTAPRIGNDRPQTLQTLVLPDSGINFEGL